MSKKAKDPNAYISFHIKIHMDGEDVVNIKDNVKIPYMVDKSHLPHAESNFSNILNSMVINPVNTRVSGKIRELLEQSLVEKREEIQADIGNKPNDIFLENKEEAENDKQQKGSSSSSSKEGEQGDKGQEPEEGEWDAPDPISG